MRELKLRLWDKDNQKMVKPQGMTFDPKSLAPFSVKVPGKSWDLIEKFELLQWTGLCDSNGTNVYEGDFIQIASTLYTVTWNEIKANFELVEHVTFLKRSINDITLGVVVGNQFENTDLINS